MDGRVYIIQGVGEGTERGRAGHVLRREDRQEALGARVNVFHTDIVSSRLGWTTLTADPATGNVYAHTTAGDLLCFDKAGKLVWQRQLTEEFGRVTGYGGRIVVADLRQRPGHRRHGQPQLGRPGPRRRTASSRSTARPARSCGSPTPAMPLNGTYYSNPVVAVINGQRLLITGGGDGCAPRLQGPHRRAGLELPRSAPGVVNGSPGRRRQPRLLRPRRGEPRGRPDRPRHLRGREPGRPTTKKPKLVWEYQQGRSGSGCRPRRWPTACSTCPTTPASCTAFDAKNGKVLWKYRYATEVRGAPLVADGKLYIFDVKAKMHDPQARRQEAAGPDRHVRLPVPRRERACRPRRTARRSRSTAAVLHHPHRPVTASATRTRSTAEAKYKPLPAETPFKQDAVAGARLFPADVTAKPGEKVKFKVVYVDANGREVKDMPRRSAKCEWTHRRSGQDADRGAGPPPLNGEDRRTARSPLGAEPRASRATSTSKLGGLTARARVRVAPQIAVHRTTSTRPRRRVARRVGERPRQVPRRRSCRRQRRCWRR